MPNLLAEAAEMGKETLLNRSVSALQVFSLVIGLLVVLGGGALRFNSRLEKLEWLADQRGGTLVEIHKTDERQDKVINEIAVHLASIDANISFLAREFRRH